jgi:hypothetical protein
LYTTLSTTSHNAKSSFVRAVGAVPKPTLATAPLEVYPSRTINKGRVWRMLMNRKEQQHRIMGLLRDIASRAVEMSEAERDTYLQREKRELYNDAIKTGMTPEGATDVAERMDEWARAVIRMIQTSGGEAGGRVTTAV